MDLRRLLAQTTLNSGFGICETSEMAIAVIGQRGLLRKTQLDSIRSFLIGCYCYNPIVQTMLRQLRMLFEV